MLLRAALSLIVVFPGDGTRTGDEACDDGNSDSGDGCSQSCEVEDGWACTGGSSSAKDSCALDCGDSKRMQGDQYPDGGGEAALAGAPQGSSVRVAESCDDGNTAAGDGCDASCEVEAGYMCSGGAADAADTCASISCGDGKRAKAGADGVRSDEASSEDCDDGNTADGQPAVTSGVLTLELPWLQATAAQLAVRLSQDTSAAKGAPPRQMNAASSAAMARKEGMRYVPSWNLSRS